jgi:hypothetical protein
MTGEEGIGLFLCKVKSNGQATWLIVGLSTT